MYPLKIPAMFDFSHWEVVPSWDKVIFPLGTRVLITKATEDKDYVDPTFMTNFTAFESMPYMRGAYHFWHPNDIAGQVQLYCDQMLEARWTDKDYPPINDVEWIPPAENRLKPDNLPRGASYAYQVKTWLDLTEERLKVRPVIYSSKNAVNSMLDASGNPPVWMNDYWWFLAWYPEDGDIYKFDWIPMDRVPLGLKRENIAGWQYDEAWRLDGIPYDGVDVSVANPAFLESIGMAPLPVSKTRKIFINIKQEA